jgi:DNA-binding Lrp family transcriptional regulator
MSGRIDTVFSIFNTGKISCTMGRAANMVTSIILMNVERTRINEVAAQMVDFDEISEVYSVSGKYDLIAIVRVRANEDLSNLVTTKLRNVEGITATETMLAFQAYSKHDLESMFSLGLDG